MYDRGKGGRARATGGGKNERSGNLSTFLSPFIYFSVLPKKGISLTAPAALIPPLGRSRGAMIASFLLFCIIRCEDVTLSILPCQRKSMCAASFLFLSLHAARRNLRQFLLFPLFRRQTRLSSLLFLSRYCTTATSYFSRLSSELKKIGQSLAAGGAAAKATTS